MRIFDVVVIGAGPAGSCAALSLARAGYAVALLEKEQFPREKLCGDFINPAIWPIYRALGVDREILSTEHEDLSAIRFTLASGDGAMVAMPSRFHEAPFGLGIKRATLDTVLLQAAARAGVSVLQRHRLKRISRETQAWRIDAEHESVAEGFRARILIGADGRNSRVAYQSGLSSTRLSAGNTAGLQLRLKNFRKIPGRVEIHVFPGGYAGLVQLGDGTANLCLAVRKDRLPRGRPADLPWRLGLARNPFLEELLREAEFSEEARFIFPVYFPPRRSYAERLLLVGDAAQVIEPVTGEGVYFAAASGLLAAQTIDEAFKRGDASAAQLSLYARRFHRALWRRRKLNRVIQYLIYRPALLQPLIRFSSQKSEPFVSLVHSICLPDRKNFLTAAFKQS
jgi:geranylgeranyl reductase family protein